MTNCFISELLCSKGTKVIQYKPRTVRIKHYLAVLERNFKIEHNLSVLSGKPKEDQTLYQITLSDGSEFVIFCHDSRMTIGIGIRDWNQ